MVDEQLPFGKWLEDSGHAAAESLLEKEELTTPHTLCAMTHDELASLKLTLGRRSLPREAAWVTIAS